MAVTPEQQPVQPEGIPGIPKTKEEVGRLLKAIKAFSEAKDKGIFDRIGIFLEVLFTIEKEESKVSEDTKKAVEKGVDETTKGAQDAAGLDKTKVADKADQDFWDENLARAVKSHKSLPQTQQGFALEAMKKLEKAVNGGAAEPLNSSEAAALGASTVVTLQELKKTFPNKEDFQKALVRLKDLSQNSKFPLEKVMQAGGLLNMSDGEKLAVVQLFGMSTGEALELKEHMEKIEKGTISDDAVTLIKKYFFPNTDAINVKEVLTTLQGVMTGSAVFGPETLTNLVFLINDADYGNFVKVLTAKE